MIKICLCSDNHGDYDVIQRILSANPDCDYYIHCGDSMLETDQLSPFISVQGNCDYYDEYDKRIVLEIADKRILLIHGNGYIDNQDLLDYLIEEEKIDIVFYGHTHRFSDFIYENIRYINPGSCRNNRDGTRPSYALVYIDDDNITVKRFDL